MWLWTDFSVLPRKQRAALLVAGAGTGHRVSSCGGLAAVRLCSHNAGLLLKLWGSHARPSEGLVTQWLAAEVS